MQKNQPGRENIVSTRRKSRKGVPVYIRNPFWEPYEVKVGHRIITVAGGMHISEEGEQVSHSGIHVVEEVDKDQFIKIYTKNMKLIFDLKPITQRVLMAVLDAVQKAPGMDRIYLNWFVVEDFSIEHDLGVSERSFYNSIKEMILKGFIAESDQPNMYWINPHLFFNGDRMRFIKEYRIKEQKGLKKSRSVSEKSTASAEKGESDGQG